MGIPVNDDYLRNMLVSVQIEETKREVALRTQEDYRVFISYSHFNRDVAKHITEVFDRKIIRYSIDEKALEWGGKIGETVREQLTACTHYLLILSEASAKSHWCSFEYGLAAGQNKKVLIFLVGAVSIPAFAEPVLATADLNVVENYFRRQLIDDATVDRFIAELLDDGKAKLNGFVKVGEADGRGVWDSPEREAIENARRSLLDDDGYSNVGIGRLVRIEVGSVENDSPLVLRYCQPGYRPTEYKFAHSGRLNAVTVTPKKEGSDPLEGRSVEQQLKGETSWGWRASRDVWEKTLDRLHIQLTGPQGAA